VYRKLLRVVPTDDPVTIFGLRRYTSQGVITIFPAIYSPSISVRQLDAIPVMLNDLAIGLFTITHFHIYLSKIAGEDSGTADKVLQDVVQFIAKWFRRVHNLTLLFRDPDIHRVSLSYSLFFSFSR
jgi:hypothetical protein